MKGLVKTNQIASAADFRRKERQKSAKCVIIGPEMSQSCEQESDNQHAASNHSRGNSLSGLEMRRLSLSANNPNDRRGSVSRNHGNRRPMPTTVVGFGDAHKSHVVCSLTISKFLGYPSLSPKLRGHPGVQKHCKAT